MRMSEFHLRIWCLGGEKGSRQVTLTVDVMRPLKNRVIDYSRPTRVGDMV